MDISIAITLPSSLHFRPFPFIHFPSAYSRSVVVIV